MTPPNDEDENPPAFPRATVAGMSLRDFFAAAALTGFLADYETDPTPEEAADGAYKYADAMLARRAKQ